MTEKLYPVVILAGGLATRLRPITETIPKALVEVAGKPFMAHQLELLRKQGIERVVLCVGYLGEKIVEAVGDGSRFGLNVEYSFDGPVLLGTAGAIRKALPGLAESFFVLYGDSYLECDYRAVQEAFEGGGKRALMTVYRNEGQWDTSNVEYGDGSILAYSKHERTARMQHIDYGLGVFRREAFANVSDNRPCSLEDVYQNILRQGDLAAFEVSQRFYEIGSPAGLEELRRHLGNAGSRLQRRPG